MQAVALGTDAATFTVTISRTGLPEGTYAADLTVQTVNGGNETIRISLVVRASDPPPGFSRVFVLIIDATTLTTVAQRELTLPTRTFAFTGVPPGRYLIVAGTDEDDDGEIDDPPARAALGRRSRRHQEYPMERPPK